LTEERLSSARQPSSSRPTTPGAAEAAAVFDAPAGTCPNKTGLGFSRTTMTIREASVISPKKAAALRQSKDACEAKDVKDGGGTHRSTIKARLVRRSSSLVGVDSGAKDEGGLLQHGYKEESPIAAGAFSQVVRARHLSTGKEVAVKTFQTRARGGKAAAVMKDVHAEIESLMRLQPTMHGHVANIIESFESDSELHCILEYCQGGSLQKHLQAQGHAIGLPEVDAFTIACQVACALGHMHALGVAHRDVKPDNLIFNDRSRAMIRLVDFGFATCHDGRRLRTVCGSPAYMSPELIANKPYIGPPVDVWALGALLYELIHNKTAFRGETMAQLHTRIRKAAHTPFAPETSGRVKVIVKKALVVEVENRADAMTIARALHDVQGVHVAAMPHRAQ